MNILSLPAIYSLELTAACNNHCPGCSNIYATDRSPRHLSALEWEQILAEIAPDAVQIRLTGGEPSLHPEFFRILQAAASYNARITIFTNARWRKPREFVRKLSGQSNLSGLLVSLHGATPASHESFCKTRGAFDETVGNISLAVQNGITVAISTVLTSQSIPEIDAVIDLANSLGVTRIAFNRYLGAPLPGIEPTREEYHLAIQKIDAHMRAGAPVRYGVGVPQCFVANASSGCLAGVAYAAIGPEGNLRPCAHSPTSVGSLKEASIRELWHNPVMAAWRTRIPAPCMSCAAFSTCHGGCRAVPELRPEASDPLRCEPLETFTPEPKQRTLHRADKPRFTAHVRQESFGYVVLGSGSMLPVRPEAAPILAACDGQHTFGELEERFGMSGINLLGEMWAGGLLEIA